MPLLAESWEQLDDTTVQFKLRQGVTFHNGEPFNAETVKYNVERIWMPMSSLSKTSSSPSSRPPRSWMNTPSI